MGKDINIHDVKEIRTRTSVFFGVGAIQKSMILQKTSSQKESTKLLLCPENMHTNQLELGTLLKQL